MNAIVIRTLAILLAATLLGGCAARKSGNGESFQEFAWGGDSELTADQHLQVGRGMAADGKPEMALVHLNRAQNMAPENIEIRAFKGEMLLEQGATEAALREFRAVLEKQPDHAGAHEGAGVVFYLAGLDDEAEEHLQSALETNPERWKANCYYGVLHDRRGNPDLAAKHFRLALKSANGKDAARVVNNLGVTHMARQQYRQAARLFRNALESGGASARTYNNLGLALTRMGRLDEALEAFRYGGNESKAYNNLGYVLLMEGRPQQAAGYFERAVELSPTFYDKAFENLKRARMAASSGTENEGSTPNLPPLASSGNERRSIAEAAALPAAATATGPAADPASLGFTSLPPGFADEPEATASAPTATEATATETVATEATVGEMVAEDATDVSAAEGVSDTIEEKRAEYGLHVSSWRDTEHARKHMEALKHDGFESSLATADLGEKGVWHRVLVGHYSSLQEAMDARPAVLKRLGLEQAGVYPLTEAAQ